MRKGITFLRNDVRKLLRFAAVSAITVPMGIALLWLLLQTDMSEVLANVIAASVSTIPNYFLNRYWVWNKRGRNSVSREIAPFWAMAFVGLVVSTLFVWIASKWTEADLVFLAANFAAFSFVWVFKFTVIERYLFGESAPQQAASAVR